MFTNLLRYEALDVEVDIFEFCEKVIAHLIVAIGQRINCGIVNWLNPIWKVLN
jgi:hypothetical protein